MKLKNIFLFSLVFSGSFVIAAQKPRIISEEELQESVSALTGKIITAYKEDCHVVYSPSWYETAERKNYKTNKTVRTADPVMTFGHKYTGTSSNGKLFFVGDDGTTFYHSYAMKFANLGKS